MHCLSYVMPWCATRWANFIGDVMITKTIACALAALALASGLANADEADIRKAITSLYGKELKVDAVRKAGMLGLYEVQIGSDILYSDEKGSYLIQGEIIDAKAKANITEARKNKLSQIKFSDLPLDLAVKTVRGNGHRVFATFEDPNCGYCKRFEKDLQKIDNITVYLFLYPILSADSMEKARNIWCSKDKPKTWQDWMTKGQTPSSLSCESSAMLRNLEYGKKHKINGTPTILLADGSRVPGAIEAKELEKLLLDIK